MLKKIIKRLSFRAFEMLSRFGLFVLPVHYYVPLASIGELKRTKATWATKSSLPGVDSNIDEQVKRLQTICLPYATEYAGNKTFREAVERQFGPGYGYIEAQALHGIIRHFKPQRIIEVGSGVSTACILAALEKNKAQSGDDCKLSCIEPYPSQELESLEAIELIRAPVQTVDYELFETLGKGDLLFIDSSHAIKPGSDVNFLILEVLPRLAPGVVVHFHDIYLPYDYPRDVLRTYFQWMETSLLRAYLINNDRAQIIFCLSQLHYDRQEELREVFAEYVPAPDRDGLEVYTTNNDDSTHFPASIFLEIH